MSDFQERLVIVSNRLPLQLRRDANACWHAEPAIGGLVSALTPVLQQRGGLWIGWTGVVAEEQAPTDQVLHRLSATIGYTLASVPLSAESHDRFYLGFANAIVQAMTMPMAERQARMARLQQAITGQTIFWWVERFLRAQSVPLPRRLTGGLRVVALPDELHPMRQRLRSLAAGGTR